MGAGSVFLRRGGGTIDRGRRQARESHRGDQDAGHPLYTRRREPYFRHAGGDTEDEGGADRQEAGGGGACRPVAAELAAAGPHPREQRAIRDLDPVALVEPHLRRRQFREQAARAAPRMLPHRNDDPVAALLGKVACEVTVAAHLAVPLEYRPVRHLAALPQAPHLRRRELSVVRNQAAATSRGVLYGAARGAVEPRNA